VIVGALVDFLTISMIHSPVVAISLAVEEEVVVVCVIHFKEECVSEVIHVGIHMKAQMLVEIHLVTLHLVQAEPRDQVYVMHFKEGNVTEVTLVGLAMLLMEVAQVTLHQLLVAVGPQEVEAFAMHFREENAIVEILAGLVTALKVVEIIMQGAGVLLILQGRLVVVVAMFATHFNVVNA